MKFKRLLLFVVLCIFLGGCKWLDSIVESIESHKGKRAVDFVVVAPVRRDANGNFSDFDTERAKQVRDAVINGVKAAGTRYTPLYISESQGFYTSIRDSDEVRPILARSIRQLKSTYPKTEAVIFGYQVPQNDNATAELYYLFLYDSTEGKLVGQQRTVRFTNYTEFYEDLSGCANDLVKKAYD